MHPGSCGDTFARPPHKVAGLEHCVGDNTMKVPRQGRQEIRRAGWNMLQVRFIYDQRRYIRRDGRLSFSVSVQKREVSGPAGRRSGDPLDLDRRIAMKGRAGQFRDLAKRHGP